MQEQTLIILNLDRNISLFLVFFFYQFIFSFSFAEDRNVSYISNCGSFQICWCVCSGPKVSLIIKLEFFFTYYALVSCNYCFSLLINYWCIFDLIFFRDVHNCFWIQGIPNSSSTSCDVWVLGSNLSEPPLIYLAKKEKRCT